MKFGIYISPTDDPKLFGDLAAAVEEAGFDSVFLPEHTHVPVEKGDDRPLGTLPHDTFRGADPFIHLAVAATTTEEILLGTAATLLTERDPIILAKVTASIDQLSGGRLVLGLGAGWNHAELRNHGVEPSTRWDVWSEKVAAMRAIWTQDVAEYSGEYVSFGALRQQPKPVTKPHPPMWVSANGPRSIRRAIAAGVDGWQPIFLPGTDPFPIDERVAYLRELETGTTRMEITLLDFRGPPQPDAIASLEHAGVGRLVHRLEVAPVEDFTGRLAEHARVTAGFA